MRKIAILLLVHKEPAQLERLLRRLDDERFDFYIHIDAKSDINAFRGVESLVKASNVIWVKCRVKTYFNDFSLVEATCHTMEQAIDARVGYKYYVLLTGQDYPIKSNNTIYSTLMNNYPMSYIDMYGVDEAFSKGVKWVEHVGHNYFSQTIRKRLLNLVGGKIYFSSGGKILKFWVVIYDKVMTLFRYSPRKKIKRLKYVYSAGSHFWILPDKAVEFILEKYKSDENVNKIFRHAAAPEESYFQTILSAMHGLQLPDEYIQFESQEKEMDNPALRLIKWYENGVHTNGHPAIWQMKDRDFMERANALFARKFDSTIDSDILDYFDNIR